MKGYILHINEPFFYRIEGFSGEVFLKFVDKAFGSPVIRNVAGLSAKQFIINRIVLEIKRYLSQGELMNYEIADMLGFGEESNMTKFFKRYVGKSPKAFRTEDDVSD